MPARDDFTLLYRERRQFGPGSVYTDAHQEVARAYLADCLDRIRLATGRDHGAPLRVLEVGAGRAVLCQVVKTADPRAVTVAQDISPECHQACPWVERYLVGEVPELEEELAALGPYDVISLTHVLEHVPDPVDTLARLGHLLRGRGVLLVTAPHRPLEAGTGREFDDWAAYGYLHIPEHLQYFSEESLRRAAGRAGFEVARWDATHEQGQAFEAWLHRPLGEAEVGRALGVGVLDTALDRAPAWSSARPFPHVVIDEFLDPAFCAALLAEFPPTNLDERFVEFGRPLGKVTVEDLWAIGPAFERFDALARAPRFLAFLEQITGIPDLVFDPHYVGGGTHENLDGQALHPHVDFNYHPTRGWHRRLNLIVYLNPVWDEGWGGCIDLHSDPRDPAGDDIVRYAPLLNRAIAFETSEASWHGFETLRLPADGPASRRSISIYYYSSSRAPESTAPSHMTVYVPPSPLGRPPEEGRALMEEWGHLLEHYQRLEQTLSAQIQALRAQLEQFRAAARPTVIGFVKVTTAVEGHYPDGWTAPEVALALELLRPSSRLVLRGWRPPGSTPGGARLWLDGQPAATVEVAEGSFELAAAIRRDAGARLTVRVECAPVGARVRGADTRALAYVWVELVVDAGAIGD